MRADAVDAIAVVRAAAAPPASAMDVVVVKSALNKVSSVVAPALTIAAGDALLAVRKWSFTANNISYAVAGAALRYWDFFPAGSPEVGRIPVWGVAEVVASRAEGVTAGQRVYGYLPMSSFLVVRPDPASVSRDGFSDVTPHRLDLPGAYQRCECPAPHWRLGPRPPLTQHEVQMRSRRPMRTPATAKRTRTL